LIGATTVALKSHLLRKISTFSLLAFAILGLGRTAGAQNLNFAGNEHHTNVYPVAGQALNKVKWTTAIDTNSGGQFAHYGQPLITTAGTALVPRLLTGIQFQINAFDGTTGASKYTLSSDYIYPAQDSWLVPYQPCVVGTRVYYPGAGGTIWYVDNIDSNTPTAPTRLCFYGLPTYSGNTAGYNGSVFIDTPITADSSGNLFFGFRVQNTVVAPFVNNGNGDVSGWARISSTGVGTYVFVDAMTSDPVITRDSHALAPALSNDESTVYVVGKKFDTSYYAYIVGLDATTLATKYKRFIQDPRPSGISAAVHESGTACPLVAPDGDVYLGCFVNPYNGSRGFLAHYSGDLGTVKTPGAFGWDFTPGIVPASMVPSYHGSSSYLLFCKYNNYTGTGQDDGGDGRNTVAILDPNDQTQVDWHPQAAGMTEMREVMTVTGCTPDVENPGLVEATREWCVNATAVDPTTGTIFFNSEDGNSYRWNLAQNSLAETLNLTTGFGEPYVPQSIGPDGTVYTFNGTFFFAMGEDPGVKITLDSSEADNRTAISGDNITFTAHVSGGATPTGTVTFTDVSFDGLTKVPQTLGTAPLVSGAAAISTTALTSDLTPGNSKLPSHFIMATYNGDGSHPVASITRIQKVHSNATTLVLTAGPTPTPYGQPVILSATVSSTVPGAGTPTGYVFFRDGNKALGQIYLDGSDNASLTTTAISVGSRTITAEYASDIQFAASSSTAPVTISGVSSVNASPATFHSGNTSAGTVTMGSAAPPSGSVVTLSSSSPNVTVPASVTVTSGNTTANFTIGGTNTTYLDIPSTITATFGSVATKNVILQPDNRSSFVSQVVPTTMTCGQSYPVTLVYKNTGTVVWDQPHGYKLYSANAYNNSTWGMNRIPMTSTTVNGGANGNFGATVIAPSTPGVYNFQWQTYEQSDNMIFGSTSTNVAITVSSAADAARYISRTGATTVNAGADFYVQNTMKNVGTNTWTSAAQYHMMTVNPNNDPKWTATILYMPANSSIAPGAQVTLTRLCTAPITPGTYTMQWQMDKNGTPFGDKSPLLNINVVQGADNAQYVSETAIPTSVGPGVSFTANFTMKNTGTAGWTAANYSLLPTGSNNFGVANIASPTVAAGATGTFPGAGAQTFTAPATPGTYTFQWRMAHGATKFGQPTPLITIVVSSADASQYISRTGPLTVNAGQDFYIQNLMKNTGVTTWSTGTGYSIMTVYPANNDTTWTATRGYLASGSIAPGATGTFTASCRAPIIPGTSYMMQWQMDKNGVPFGEKSPLLNVIVVQGPDDAQFVSQTGVPTSIVHGTTFNATITMKNLGTATWDGTYSLASVGSNTFGIGNIVATSTAQNANKAFTATFTAPVTPGTYTFQMRMQHPTTKFGQPGTLVTITVT
jgi:hypothetical protein